jgi:hypothetical protein
VLSLTSICTIVLPGGVGNAQVGDGKPPEKGSTTGPNFSGVSCRLRIGTRQAALQKLYLHELSLGPQSFSHPGYEIFKGRPVMGQIINEN